MASYLHGYSSAEAARLVRQAGLFEALIHDGTSFATGVEVLEAGCGVGAQTIVLARRNPEARFTCIDVSEASLAIAQARITDNAIANVGFRHADLLSLPFDEASFDHVFMNFVLEHCGDPAKALRELHRVLRPGGTITITEPDHGTSYFHPATDATRRVFRGMVGALAAMGGDGEIGHKLFPLLRLAGFQVDSVEPRPLYVDGRFPEQIEAIVGGVVVPALETTRENMITYGGMAAAAVDQGLDEWRTLGADPGFVFTTTLFRAVATRL
jgi:SAM-dependent methyltransferase